jgi:hypothetical protein
MMNLFLFRKTIFFDNISILLLDLFDLNICSKYFQLAIVDNLYLHEYCLNGFLKLIFHKIYYYVNVMKSKLK